MEGVYSDPRESSAPELHVINSKYAREFWRRHCFKDSDDKSRQMFDMRPRVPLRSRQQPFLCKCTDIRFANDAVTVAVSFLIYYWHGLLRRPRMTPFIRRGFRCHECPFKQLNWPKIEKGRRCFKSIGSQFEKGT